MSSSKEYRDFVLEQLSGVDGITVRPMMGEYLLYCNGILFGGVYDDNLLVKRVESNRKYGMQEIIPYPGAKPMYLVDDIDNRERLNNIVFDTCKDLYKK
ncbi:MAG: TfoX/Sxy family protein [Clostridia bacterium]|nr:TfoX/Sxy family protein [Clostridia bacterium]